MVGRAERYPTEQCRPDSEDHHPFAQNSTWRLAPGSLWEAREPSHADSSAAVHPMQSWASYRTMQCAMLPASEVQRMSAQNSTWRLAPGCSLWGVGETSRAEQEDLKIPEQSCHGDNHIELSSRLEGSRSYQRRLAQNRRGVDPSQNFAAARIAAPTHAPACRRRRRTSRLRRLTQSRRRITSPPHHTAAVLPRVSARRLYVTRPARRRRTLHQCLALARRSNRRWPPSPTSSPPDFKLLPQILLFQQLS